MEILVISVVIAIVAVVVALSNITLGSAWLHFNASSAFNLNGYCDH